MWGGVGMICFVCEHADQNFDFKYFFYHFNNKKYIGWVV